MALRFKGGQSNPTYRLETASSAIWQTRSTGGAGGRVRGLRHRQSSEGTWRRRNARRYRCRSRGLILRPLRRLHVPSPDEYDAGLSIIPGEVLFSSSRSLSPYVSPYTYTSGKRDRSDSDLRARNSAVGVLKRRVCHPISTITDVAGMAWLCCRAIFICNSGSCVRRPPNATSWHWLELTHDRRRLSEGSYSPDVRACIACLCTWCDLQTTISFQSGLWG